MVQEHGAAGATGWQEGKRWSESGRAGGFFTNLGAWRGLGSTCGS